MNVIGLYTTMVALVCSFQISQSLPASPASMKTPGENVVIHEIDSKIQCIKYGPLWDREPPHLALVTRDGRCVVLWLEGNRWHDELVFQMKEGFSGLATGDIDEDAPGNELLVATGTGRLYCIEKSDGSPFASKMIYQSSSPAGDLLVHDLVPSIPGNEILVLTEEGKAEILSFHEKNGASTERNIQVEVVIHDTSRLRNAVAGPHGPDHTPGVLVAGSSGSLFRIFRADHEWHTETVFQNESPLARVAAGPLSQESDETAIVVVDDAGAVTLLSYDGKTWSPRLIHRERKALRGVVIAELLPHVPGREIAVFGYAMEVPVFFETEGRFERKVLYKDTDKGHWLISCRIDMDSPSEELVAVGYSGKVSIISP